eukprot:457522-Amphidinium_carterae.1
MMYKSDARSGKDAPAPNQPRSTHSEAIYLANIHNEQKNLASKSESQGMIPLLFRYFLRQTSATWSSSYICLWHIQWANPLNSTDNAFDRGNRQSELTASDWPRLHLALKAEAKVSAKRWVGRL